jgi:Ulp1 family protease
MLTDVNTHIPPEQIPFSPLAIDSKVQRSDIFTLKPGHWLNSSCISTCLKLISLSSITHARTLGKCHMATFSMDSEWYNIMQRDPTGYTAADRWISPHRLRLYGYESSHLDTTAKLHLSIFNFWCLLIPVNVNESHWVLLVIHPQRQVIGLLDSLYSGPHSSPPSHTPWSAILTTAVRWMEHLQQATPASHIRPDVFMNGIWSTRMIPCTHQQDEINCGVWVLLNSLAISTDAIMNDGSVFSECLDTRTRMRVPYQSADANGARHMLVKGFWSQIYA